MISIKNLTLLLAVLLMGFCLVSSAAAMDIDDSDSLSASDDLSVSSVSSVDENLASDSSSSDLESSDAGASNVNSENEVLSTDYTVEDSDLEYDSNDKGTKSVLGASDEGSSTLQASSKTKTSIKASSSSVYRGESFSITLKDAKGKALSNKKVNFKINGKTYARTTNSNGLASLTINLKGSKYPITCTFDGTSSYSASSLSLTLSVNAKPTSISSNGNSVIKGNAFSVTLKDSSGKALADQKVNFKISGKTYSRTTDSKGIASMTINLAANKYPVVCSFAGSDNYKSSSLSVTLTVKKNPNGFSIKEIETAATNVKAFVAKNKKLPNTVTVGSKTLKISEFSYLASKAVSNLNSNIKKDIILLSGISNGGSSAHSLKSTVYKAQYVDLAKGVASTIESKKVPPTYVAVKDSAKKTVGNANFDLYTFAFSKILDFHKSKAYLPNYCTFESSAIASTYSQKTTTIKAGSTTITRGDPYKITLVDENGKALANQKITMTISGKSYSRTTDSNGAASLTINLVSGKYSVVSSFGGSSTYKSSKLTKTVTVKNSTSRFFLNDIEAAASNVESYVNSKAVLPNTVTVAGNKLSVSQFSYLMSKAIYNINAGSSKYITLPSSMSKCNSSESTINAKVYKAQYLDLAKRVMSFEEANKTPPVYAKVYNGSGASLGNARFDVYTYAFAKILDFYKSKNYLPSYCTFQSSVFSGSVVPSGVSDKINYSSAQFKNGLNEKNTETDLAKYLVGTGQSAITSSIKDLANKLTKGLKTTDAKALAIYNYVRDEIDYSYYANSKHGAAGTLSAGSGNCVDQASLVVALCRAAGIHARYSHAKGCTFSSGLVTGHVWAQILVDGVWYSADATSSRNQLGNIKNWNTNSYSNLNKYAAIPF